MNEALKPGLTFEFRYRVPEEKTVPFLYPEAEEFQVMPAVLATGFMVGLFEWACIRAIEPYLDWPERMTLGTGVYLSHLAATPPGLIVTVRGEVTKVEGRKLTFTLQADDGVDKISEGTHERVMVDLAKFNDRMAKKKAEAPFDLEG